MFTDSDAYKWLEAACIEIALRGGDEELRRQVDALAEMAEWLSHPNEFGRPPDELERVDTRTLAWPPTRDTRRLWLVRYRYENPSPHGQAEEGVGLVGSVTFALFGEATCARSVDDLYGLYCAWELEVRGDPRAPEQRSSAAGRALLDRAARDGPDFA